MSNDHPTLSEPQLDSIPHRDEEKLEQFSRQLADLLFNYMIPSKSEQKVVDFLHPDDLKNKLELIIDQNPTGLENILKGCDNTIKYSVNTGHQNFFNQLFAKVDVISLLGDWLTSTLNASMYTYEVAPVFVLMEQYMIEKIGKLVGFTEIDGIFAPGGSMSNLYSLLMAREQAFPEVKKQGLTGLGKHPVVFTSAHSHYSITKGCIMLGLGMDSCISVKCTDDGCMDPSDLKHKIEQSKQNGQTPFYVNATAGTTVFGSFDPFTEIGQICKENNLWMHIDGAWGGSVMLSRETRNLIKGSELADSFTWNPHKMMGVPLQCSLVVVNNKKGLMNQAISTKAGYLFQQDKLYPIEYDTGDKAYQCGRKVDAFKLWILWKARGDLGMEKVVNSAFDFKDLLISELNKRSNFKIVTNPQCTNVCFWCIPSKLQSLEDEVSRNEILNKLAPLVKNEMQKHGTTLVGYQQLGNLPNFWRMICISATPASEDVVWLLDLIEKYSNECLEICMSG